MGRTYAADLDDIELTKLDEWMDDPLKVAEAFGEYLCMQGSDALAVDVASAFIGHAGDRPARALRLLAIIEGHVRDEMAPGVRRAVNADIANAEDGDAYARFVERRQGVAA